MRNDLDEEMNSDTNSMSEKRILVIDDNRDTATIIEKVLLHKGFSVSAYTDPTLAVAHYSTDNDYELVLVDTEMPVLSGYQVSRRIKKINPNSKVLLMKSHYEHESDESLSWSEADGIIEKPVRLVRMADIIEDFIRSSSNDQILRTRYHI